MKEAPHSKKSKGGVGIATFPCPLRRQTPIKLSNLARVLYSFLNWIWWLPHFLIWVAEPHLRWHMENQRLLSVLKRVRWRFDVREKVVISDGVRNDRMQNWTSSGNSEKVNDGVAIEL